jgi:hypothetical protein
LYAGLVQDACTWRAANFNLDSFNSELNILYISAFLAAPFEWLAHNAVGRLGYIA